LRNYRKQTAKASVAGSAPSDKVVAAKPAAASTTLSTVTQAPDVSATAPRVKLQNGGWLQKYGNGGYVKKFGSGQSIENMLFGKPMEIISPKNRVSTTNDPYSHPIIDNTYLMDALSSGKLKTSMGRYQPAVKKSEAGKNTAVNGIKVEAFYSQMPDSDKRALQDMLKNAGYYNGEIDGLVGDETLSALIKFQQDNKLMVDGLAGKNTFEALRAKTRQVAQPVTDLTSVPGYAQAAQFLNKMNAATPVVGTTGGRNLDDVRQGIDIPLVGPKVSFGATSEFNIPQRKQGG
jgi:peptidoglycan hydrolase-like protein with peptidoglycan-binding domain